MNNTICGVFLHKLVCGILAEFLLNLTKLVRRTQCSIQRIQFKRHQCLNRVINTVSGVYLSKVVCGK